MGIIDHGLLLSDSQLLTETQHSYNSTDLSRTARDIGTGKIRMKLEIRCMESVSAPGPATIDFQVTTGAAQPFETVMGSTGPVDKALLVQGKVFSISLSPGDWKRYLGANYVVTGTPSAGRFTAYVTEDEERTTYFPEGFKTA